MGEMGAGHSPTGMVWIEPGEFWMLPNFFRFTPVTGPGYHLDEFEVSNREFKSFVDQGGYQNQDYWNHLSFQMDGKVISWEEATSLFVDSTGRAGPATWILGNYPTGEADYPVSGVSWYEAAAYARFKNRDLPTIYHWVKAALFNENLLAHSVPVSNFSETATRAVSREAIGRFGTFDMAGNVREWVWNSVEQDHVILGGGWGDPAYVSGQRFQLPGFDRSPQNGFRTVLYENKDTIPKDWFNLVEFQNRDYADERPVAKEIQAVLKDQFRYGDTPINPDVHVDAVSSDNVIERVSIDTGDGSERMKIHLFLPKDRPESLQSVVYFPGMGAFQNERSSDNLNVPAHLEWILISGRSLVWPIYKGSFERHDVNLQNLDGDEHAAVRRERTIQWRQDLGRTIDYLVTRDDIDASRIAYLGFSHGASRALVILAMEKRLKAAILWSGGMPYRRLPAIADPINYMSEITLPTLMLGGKYDNRFPKETYQYWLDRMLGTDPENKRWVLMDGGHGTLPMTRVTRESADWLDRYLGPIRSMP